MIYYVDHFGSDLVTICFEIPLEISFGVCALGGRSMVYGRIGKSLHYIVAVHQTFLLVKTMVLLMD